MSELVATINTNETALPDIYQDYSHLEIVRYKNNSEHVYGLVEVDDGNGGTRLKRTHLPGFLSSYDYSSYQDKKAWDTANNSPEAWLETGRENYLRSKGMWFEATADPLDGASQQQQNSNVGKIQSFGSKVLKSAQENIKSLTSDERKAKLKDFGYQTLLGAAALGGTGLSLATSVTATTERSASSRLRALGDRLRPHRTRIEVEEPEVERVYITDDMDDSEKISTLERAISEMRADYTEQIRLLRQEHQAEMAEMEERFRRELSEMEERHQLELDDKQATIDKQAQIIEERNARIEELEDILNSDDVGVRGRIGHWVRSRYSRDPEVLEINDENIERDRRMGGVAIAGAVLATVAATAGAAALYDHYIEDAGGAKPVPEHIAPKHIGSPHTEHFAGTSRGMNGFKVTLPGNLKWQTIQTKRGEYGRITDEDGHIIVPRVGWDQEGDLDQNNIKLLKTNPYVSLKLHQKTYPYLTVTKDKTFRTHHETIVENA